jgi:hypothetical protein
MNKQYMINNEASTQVKLIEPAERLGKLNLIDTA